MRREDVMSVCVAAFVILSSLMALGSVSQRAAANPGGIFVDAAGACGGNTPCYLHPQDAVNAASTGDTIWVYPGTYTERQFTTPVPPHWGAGDQYAPALIVWKDGLTIKSVEGPSATTIETSYGFWVNPSMPGGGGGGSIEHSTGCTWNAVTKVWDGSCVRPMFGTAPNAIAIIASGVTIEGFTIRNPFTAAPGTGVNQAGVMIGGLYAGYGEHGETLTAAGNTVRDNVFKDAWHALYIWHSYGNTIVGNTVEALGNTGHWAGISVYDGYKDAQIALGHLSENNLIAENTLADKGISVGAWAPPTWTSLAGSRVLCNQATQVGVSFAHGPVTVACNTLYGTQDAAGFWEYMTDKVIHIEGVEYLGDTELWTFNAAAVLLKAQLAWDGSVPDGSGIGIVFTVDGTDFGGITNKKGVVRRTVTLVPGIYTVSTVVSISEDPPCCCEVHDSDVLVIGWNVVIDIKPGSYPNSIHLDSKGLTPVAVLHTADFDPQTIDPDTVWFAGAKAVKSSVYDVDGDGDLDVVFYFVTQELNLHASDTQATLTGYTYGGVPVKGTDSVRVK